MDIKERAEKILLLEEKFILAQTDVEKRKIWEELDEIKHNETPREIREQWEKSGNQYYNEFVGIGGYYENNT